MRERRAIGSFVPGDTLAHRLDARTKVLCLLVASIASFAAAPPAGLAVAAAGLVAALAASRTSPLRVLLALRPALLVLGFSLLANTVVLVGQPGVSVDGFLRSAQAIVRIVLVVGFALVFSATTMPPAIADALASLLRPLARLGVPVGDISTMASIALRFIPLTAEEVLRIRSAQRARGARPDEGGVLRRVTSWGQVLVPLVVSLFRRADELGRAMEDRCYTGEQTSLAGPLAARDWLALVLAAAWAALAVLL